MLLDGRTSVEVCCSCEGHRSKSRLSSSETRDSPVLAVGKDIVQAYCVW